MILIDTNVLIYAIQGDAPQHEASPRLVEAALAGSPLACLFPQVLLEFFAVMTDSPRLEKPATSAEGLDLVRRYSSLLLVLQPSPAALNILLSLVSKLGVRGQRIFDSFLVAQMMDAGIETICTYNTKDFSNYPIAARTPDEILKGIDGNAPPTVHDKPRLPR